MKKIVSVSPTVQLLGQWVGFVKHETDLEVSFNFVKYKKKRLSKRDLQIFVSSRRVVRYKQALRF